jgi:hypothetical protein
MNKEETKDRKEETKESKEEEKVAQEIFSNTKLFSA